MSAKTQPSGAVGADSRPPSLPLRPSAQDGVPDHALICMGYPGAGASMIGEPAERSERGVLAVGCSGLGSARPVTA
jgi:hypothetical protein